MSDIEIDKKLLLDILQNINIVVEKSKNLEVSVTNLKSVIFGDEINDKQGLTEKYRKIADEISSLDKILQEKIVPEINSFKDSITHSIHNPKLEDLDKRVAKTEAFVDRLSNLPKQLMWIVPIMSLLTQLVATIVIPLIYKK